MRDAIETFNEIMGALDHPMLVVTTAVGKQRAGCLVGFATQCSIEPPRFLVGLSARNRTLRLAARAETLAVHVLPAGAGALAQLFGGETGDELDKFARCAWHTGPSGLPILDDCPSWFAGRVLARHELGDHVGYLLEPFAAASDGARDLLMYSQAKQIAPGHEA
jgi:flavin reductase (DIM6/NTAB) family NADH-FMN oxidoreductase RutF